MLKIKYYGKTFLFCIVLAILMTIAETIGVPMTTLGILCVPIALVGALLLFVDYAIDLIFEEPQHDK